jgi:hypothetical protein
MKGDNKSTGATWGYTDSTVTYGGSTDKWNVPVDLTDTDVNDSSFGVRLSSRTVWSGASYQSDAEVDAITVTIYYTGGGGGAAQFAVGPYIPTAQVVGTHRVFASAAIRPSSILTKQAVPTQTVTGGRAYVLPTSLATKQIFSNNTIVGGPRTLFPSSVITAQKLSDTNRLAGGASTVYPSSILTQEKNNNNNTIVPGRSYIYPNSILSFELFSNASITSGPRTIFPNSIFRNDAVTSGIVTSGRVSLIPSSIVTNQNITNTNIYATTKIFPFSIAGKEIFNNVTITLGRAVILPFSTPFSNCV